jgi:plasmid stability protein
MRSFASVVLALCTIATLHVRNVPDRLYERLRRRAEANGRSIGAEAVALLDERLSPERARRGLRGARRRGRAAAMRAFSGSAAREVIEAASEEARALGQGHIGSEHLLLALLRDEAGAVADILGALGLGIDAVRAEVERGIDRGEAAPAGEIPFTPRAKKVLELALREAIAQDEEEVRRRHVALAIVQAGEGAAFELVRAAAPDLNELRRRLTDAHDEPALDEAPPIRVVELTGAAGDWEAQLNEAGAAGYDVVAIVERRAILRRD